MKKTISLGKCDYSGKGRTSNEGRIKIELENGTLSITGEIWMTNYRDILVGGQCVDTLLDSFPDNATLKLIAPIWDRWHLNDMRAGTVAQETWLRENLKPSDYEYPLNHYDVACAKLAAVGLNPDNGYSYGSKWLREELPAAVLAILKTLGVEDTVEAK